MKAVKITVFVSSYFGIWAIIRHSGGRFRKTFKSVAAVREWAGARGCSLAERFVAGFETVMTGSTYEYILSHKGDFNVQESR